jgi:hypothetical protein
MAAAWLSGARGLSNGNVSQLDTAGFNVSGSDKYLRVLVHVGAGTPAAVNSVVWDPTGVNQSLTQIETDITFATNFRCSVWALVAPSNVTGGVVRVTWAANQDETMVIADCYTGIDQATPTRTLPTPAQGTSTTPSLSVTSVSGDLVVGSVAAGQTSAPDLTTVTSSTLTVRESVPGTDIGGFEQCGQGDTTASGTSTTASYSLGTAGATPSWVLFGAALIPAAGGGDTLMGQQCL